MPYETESTTDSSELSEIDIMNARDIGKYPRDYKKYPVDPRDTRGYNQYPRDPRDIMNPNREVAFVNGEPRRYRDDIETGINGIS